MATATEMKMTIAGFILGKPTRVRKSKKLQVFTDKVNRLHPNPPDKLVEIYRSHAEKHRKI